MLVHRPITLMSRNAHNNKIGKITKYRQQFDDFYNLGKYGDCGEFLSNHQMYVNSSIHGAQPCWRIWRFWRIFVKSPNLCKSVPYMVLSHVSETGEYGYFGEYGDFGELLSNHKIYVNQLASTEGGH